MRERTRKLAAEAYNAGIQSGEAGQPSYCPVCYLRVLQYWKDGWAVGHELAKVAA